MGKIEESKQRKKQQLLDTAFELFTSKGISKTTIADISQQAGVAKGTFYLYFKNKEEIREHLIIHKAWQILRRALATSDYASQATAADQTIALVDNILVQLQRNPLLLRFINKNLSWGIFRRALDRSETDFLAPILEILKTDSYGYCEPRIMVYTILELAGSTCYSVILEKDPVDFETYKPYLYQSIRAIMNTFREPSTKES